MSTKRHLKKKTVNKNHKKVNLTKKIRKQQLKKTRINKLVGGEVREIEHIWFKGWPDKGVPKNMDKFNIFITKIYEDMYKNAKNTENANNTVIHCSAGVGRTGVVYVVLQLLSQGYIFAESNIEEIKMMIDTIINTERQNRNHLFVQTADQYNFIYRYFTGLEMDNYGDEYKKLKKKEDVPGPPNPDIMVNKNRYSDVLPCESQRVKLDNERYINASNMSSFLINGKTIKIIAAQCPIPETIKDFYEMLRTYNIKRIIMVTGLVEDGKLKCEDYFGSTSTSEEYINIEGVSVKVTLHHKQKGDPIERRTLTLPPDVPSRATKPTLYFNPFLTNEQVEQAEHTREMNKLNSAFKALQPFNNYWSGKKNSSGTTKKWFNIEILDKIDSKIDSYVKDEKNLGDRFRSAIEAKNNSTLFKPPYPEYFNKFAVPKIVEYSAMEKKKGFFQKNKTAVDRLKLLEEIMTYGFDSEDIEKFIRLQHNMRKILEKLTKGEKTEGMFRLNGYLNNKQSFYKNRNFELTSEVLEDTDTLCSLVKEYIGLLSKIKGSYFEEEEIKLNDKYKMLDKYLSYYPREDQELLTEIFKLFSLIMNEPETNMGPKAIAIMFMPNVEARNPNLTKDRITMYEDFFDHIKTIYGQPPPIPAAAAAPPPIKPVPAPRPPVAAPQPPKTTTTTAAAPRPPVAAPRPPKTTTTAAAPRPPNTEYTQNIKLSTNPNNLYGTFTLSSTNA